MSIHKWKKHAVYRPGAPSRWTLEVHVYAGVGKNGFYEVCADPMSELGPPQFSSCWISSAASAPSLLLPPRSLPPQLLLPR